MPDAYRVSLDTIGRGSLVERFDDALAQTVANILDPNTEPTKERVITLTVKLKPNQDRTMAAVTLDTTTKLAAPRAIGTSIYVGEENGEPVATEYNPNQPSMFEVQRDLDRMNKPPNGGGA